MSWYDRKLVDFDILIGETIVSISGMDTGGVEVVIETASGRTFRMYHVQDCCENVYIDATYGCANSILNKVVDETTYFTDNYDGAYESGTISRFRIYCDGDYFEVKWIGTSNGYYGEGVSFYETTGED